MKFKYYKYLQDNLVNNQKFLEDTISELIKVNNEVYNIIQK